MKIQKDIFSCLFIWEWAKHIMSLNLIQWDPLVILGFDESSSLNNIYNSLSKEV
jgi:hypothetical protein